ncbi:tripartite tricarboxylate transporter TctB family protein [Inquilinus limosus]|uniref:tripartite tricarboxylate transporter TctB family protein n=1 Tax=Inquilinus limosus TaxID=171674 RepID=UPI000425FEEE|nr:tripartite tricarboxylate transporter TctB family protein [Inquilinus limosus]
MADHDRQDDGTVSVRAVEIVVAAVLMIIAVVVMVDNLRIGIGWAYDGPEAGYFPFYVGLVLFLASAGILLTNLFGRSPDLGSFVGRSQLGLVLKVLVPTIVFVALIGFLGLYVAAALFIAFFMHWLGRYPVAKIVPVAVLVPAALFLMFELWFLVPLPKGPLEAMLGY